MESAVALRRILPRAVLLFAAAMVLCRLAYVGTVLFSSSSSSPAAAVAFVRPSSSSEAAVVAAVSSPSRRQAIVDYYAGIFRALADSGFLSPSARALCVSDSPYPDEILALRQIGVTAATTVRPTRLRSASGGNRGFDFIFAGRLDRARDLPDLVAGLTNSLALDGVLVVHTVSAGDPFSIASLQTLFSGDDDGCRIIESREIHAPDPSSSPVRQLLLRKQLFTAANSSDTCAVTPAHKLQIIQSAEPLIGEEPQKPWIALKRNLQNIKYLPSMADISFHRRYVYVDVGARSYGSSIGSWFRKQYPKQNHTFQVFAVEADPAFHAEYAAKKGITLLPFAAWVRNETLTFEVNHQPSSSGRGMGRILPSTAGSGDSRSLSVPGFDFAAWLKSTVSEKDFVVLKMDVEGTEFDLVPRMLETGAMCLVDELFLECHYNRWQRCCPGVRSSKYRNTYTDCLRLFHSLRDAGVLVHQWF